LGKKSEAEGIIIYHRKEGERRLSFLDDGGFPERIQGYARIASISDYAYYLYPASGRLSAPDGELAVLLESFRVPGAVAIEDQSATSDSVRATFKGTLLESYSVKDGSGSTSDDLSKTPGRPDFGIGRTLIYVDRVFNVKGLGTVALGFILSGEVSVHDSLRLSPLPRGASAEVKGIQINDVDYESAGRGIRVGLALRGIDAKDMQRTHWLDDGSFEMHDGVSFAMEKSPFYRQALSNRDLHLQLAGEMVPVSLTSGGADRELSAKLPFEVPCWDGMRVAVIDLNGKSLRVAGGGTCKA
jgi:selenocysteine-specific translation elongation factor